MNFEKLKKLSEKTWFYPVVLFLLAAFTYGYALPFLGFYWSDWEVVFYNKLSSDVDRLVGGYEAFADEFATILSRQLDS